MNELEKMFLEQGLEAFRLAKHIKQHPSWLDKAHHIIEHTDSDVDAIRSVAETTQALESLRHQGFLTHLSSNKMTIGTNWDWVWDAEKVLAWGRSREPVYRFKGLPWVNEEDHFLAPGGKTAEIIIGEYRVWYGVTSGCNGWHVTMPNVWGSQQCGSLDDGVELCEAHWLKTLIDSGVIEKASNPH